MFGGEVGVFGGEASPLPPPPPPPPLDRTLQHLVYNNYYPHTEKNNKPVGREGALGRGGVNHNPRNPLHYV